MYKTVIDIARTASLANVRELRQLLDIGLNACNIDSQQRSKISLCFSEAATNCVQHAEAVQNIGLCLFSDSFGWWVEVKDDAKPCEIELTQSNDSLSVIDIFDTDAESGRGLGLIASLAEEIRQTNDTTMQQASCGDILWRNYLRMGWQHHSKDARASLLIVDDDPALIKLYQAYLAGDYNVLVADNGNRALEVIKSHAIDLVVSDINMPGMNGIELRHALNADQNTEITPFIFLTVTEDSKIKAYTSGMGIDDFLQKPIDKQTLLLTIKRVLARSQRIKQRLSERIDQQITAALAPELPQQLGNWHVALDCRNTGQGGGDLVLHQSGDHSQLIVVVDVMGHNDAAKFFSHAYAGYLRGLMTALGKAANPKTLLENLSQGVFQDKLLSQLTLTCCAIELKENGEVEIATAGHPAPLIIKNAGIEALPVQGMLLGLLPENKYESYCFKLNKHERLAVYTDGLMESAENHLARQELETTVLGTLTENLESTTEQALQKTMQVFDHCTEGQPSDDALLLLIEPQQINN